MLAAMRSSTPVAAAKIPLLSCTNPAEVSFSSNGCALADGFWWKTVVRMLSSASESPFFVLAQALYEASSRSGDSADGVTRIPATGIPQPLSLPLTVGVPEGMRQVSSPLPPGPCTFSAVPARGGGGTDSSPLLGLPGSARKAWPSRQELMWAMSRSVAQSPTITSAYSSPLSP